MVKTYRNKTLLYEATKDGGRWQYRLWKIDSKNERMKFHHWTGVDYSRISEWKIVERYTVIDAELIENSQDREEVAEQSPQRMRDVIEEYNKNYTHLNDHKLIQALEKHYSQDREEVAEQSPQRMRDVIEEYNKNYTHLNDHKLIQALEKHFPKVKFTRDYIQEWSEKNQWINTKNLEDFLQEHWLLYEDTQWTHNQ